MTGGGQMEGRATLVVASESDSAALAAVHAGCFDSPWKAEAFAALLATPGSFALVALLAHAPAAAGMVLARVAGDDCEILTIGVPGPLRGQRIAAALLEHAAVRAVGLGAARQVLEVDTGNAAARRLYARLGFTQCGARPGYYAAAAATQGDALILARPIGPGN
jgi:ribosomal-protein-alanine N-acetyltransferase